MKATQQLHNQGQSLWLDNITRDLLKTGTLEKYIQELSVTGLTSNPTIFNHAIKNSSAYDEQIHENLKKGLHGEELFFSLALEDIQHAADLFYPIYEQTGGLDGWVSLEVSPLLAYNAEQTAAVAQDLFRKAGKENLFIKIPGTEEGLAAIEETIYRGIPVNVTLLFSTQQYLAAAEAYLKGIERRLEEGLSPHVPSVASLFISCWDVALNKKLPSSLTNKIGLAVGEESYHAYLKLIQSPRYLRLLNEGATFQRLLFASTGTKDPQALDTLYISGLAAPLTVNTMPEKTLLAFADHGTMTKILRQEESDYTSVLDEAQKAGISLEEVALQLQKEGALSFVESWNDLLAVLETKSHS